MEDFLWEISNPIFSFILWLLLSKNGPQYLPYIFILFFIFSLTLLIKTFNKNE